MRIVYPNPKQKWTLMKSPEDCWDFQGSPGPATAYRGYYPVHGLTKNQWGDVVTTLVAICREPFDAIDQAKIWNESYNYVNRVS